MDAVIQWFLQGIPALGNMPAWLSILLIVAAILVALIWRSPIRAREERKRQAELEVRWRERDRQHQELYGLHVQTQADLLAVRNALYLLVNNQELIAAFWRSDRASEYTREQWLKFEPTLHVVEVPDVNHHEAGDGA